MRKIVSCGAAFSANNMGYCFKKTEVIIRARRLRGYSMKWLGTYLFDAISIVCSCNTQQAIMPVNNKAYELGETAMTILLLLLLQKRIVLQRQS